MCAVLSCVRLFVTPLDSSPQAPLSMGFPRQEHWSGVPSPLPGDLPDPRIKLTSPESPALAGGFFTIKPPGKPKMNPITTNNSCDLIIILILCSNYYLSMTVSCEYLGHTYVTKSKPILLAVWQANKSRDELVGTRNHDFIGKLAACEDGGLGSQRTILPKLELGLVLY